MQNKKNSHRPRNILKANRKARNDRPYKPSSGLMFVAQLTTLIASEEAEADEAELLEDEHDVHHFVHCVGEGAGVDGVSGWVGAVEFGRRWGGRHCWLLQPLLGGDVFLVRVGGRFD